MTTDSNATPELQDEVELNSKRAEKRRTPISCNVEPSIYYIIEQLVGRLDMSMSSYMRQLVINDLRQRELLPDSLLAKLYLKSR